MDDDRNALVVFDVGGQRCALPAASVREVVHFAELARPPGMPAVLEGFLNYAGEVMPVVRLGTLFGLAGPAPGLYSPMLVLRPAHGRLVLLVETVRAVITPGPHDRLPVEDSAAFNGCVASEVRWQGDTVHLLDPDRVLLHQERRRMNELQEMVTARLAALEGEAS